MEEIPPPLPRRRSFAQLFTNLIKQTFIPFVMLIACGLVLYEIYQDYEEGYFSKFPNPYQFFLGAQTILFTALTLLVHWKNTANYRKLYTASLLSVILLLISSTVTGLRWYLEVTSTAAGG